MAKDNPQILIDIQLQVKQIKQQMDAVLKDVQKLNKESVTTSKDSKKAINDQAKAVKDLADKVKEANEVFSKSEKKKKDNIDETTDAVKKQTAEVSKLSKAFGAVRGGVNYPFKGGGFVGGLMSGMGLGGLGKAITGAGVGGLLGRGISRLGGGLLGFLTSGVTNAYQQYMQYGQAQGGLVGLGTPGQLRASLRGATRLGYGPTETVYQAALAGRATGNIGAVGRAQQFARGYGMDVGEAAGYMGMMRQAGYGFGGKTRYGVVDQSGTRQLAKMIEGGIVSGLEKGRLSEFIQGMGQIVQQAGMRTTGRVNVGGITAFGAMLGRTGLPGFQGMRGVNVAQQLHQAIMQPGGGEAGQAMMLQAFGFGKPGGSRGYYEALKMQQQGLAGEGGAERAKELFTEVYKQMGREGVGGSAPVNREANLALSEMTGLSLDQIEKLGDLLNSGQATEEEMKKVNELLEQAKDPQKAALDEMKKGFGGTVKYMASIEKQQNYIGKEWAPFMMKLQQLQLDILKGLSDKALEWLPKIGEALKSIYDFVSAIGDALNLTKAGSAAQKEASVGLDKLRFKDVTGLPPGEALATLSAQIKAWEGYSQEMLVKGKKSSDPLAKGIYYRAAQRAPEEINILKERMKIYRAEYETSLAKGESGYEAPTKAEKYHNYLRQKYIDEKTRTGKVSEQTLSLMSQLPEDDPLRTAAENRFLAAKATKLAEESYRSASKFVGGGIRGAIVEEEKPLSREKTTAELVEEDIRRKQEKIEYALGKGMFPGVVISPLLDTRTVGERNTYGNLTNVKPRR